MGFYISKIDNDSVNDYIGSNTIYSCADNGAFDTEINEELTQLAEENEQIMIIVDENGINHFLDILKNGKVTGRDVNKLIKIVEEKYKEGFIIKY